MPGTMVFDTDAVREEGRRIDQRTRRLRANVRAGTLDLVGSTAAGRKLSWLDSVHPIFARYHESWERNEIRLRGGEDVLDELRRFDWESRDPKPGEPRTQYEVRRERATYINFADMYATTVVGHLMRQAPRPGEGLNFGQLGEVRRERDFTQPTPAELIYYNADGVGSDGSHWDTFWTGAMKRAMATGHRWIMVEAPKQAARTWEDILNGRRPYLCEFGPQEAPWWHYSEGNLQAIIFRVPDESPRVDSQGRMVGLDGSEGYLVMTRYGYQGFGPDFAEGGWFLFDSKKRLRGEGRWTNTRGEIPVFPLFYERDPGSRTRRSLSRGGLTELGALGVAYMDAASARLFDAWDAAMSVTYLLGVDKAGFNLATDKLGDGSRVVPVPIAEAGLGATPVVPTVSDGSSGAVVAGVFDSLEVSMMRAAQRIGVAESTSAPDSSGISKVAGWNEEKSPRMVLAAGHLEQAQTMAIHFLELRWGFARPTGSTAWSRKFDLIALVDDITAIFNLEKLSGLRSKTLGAKMMVAAAEDRGLLNDDSERKAVQGEYEESAQAALDREAALQTLAGDFGTGAL